MIADIQLAKTSVTVESYIFANDRLTAKILKALTEAAHRGCDVRLLVDGFGSYGQIRYLKDYCQKNRILFAVFHPIPYWLGLLFTFLQAFVTLSTRFLDLLNSRNHRKITVIDNQVAYLGSLNFVEDHCESLVGKKAWRDTGVRVEGPRAAIFSRIFSVSLLRTLSRDFVDWINRWKLRNTALIPGINLNTTKRMRKLWYKRLVRTILRAEKRVYITTAYFLPRRALAKALTIAKQRGVEVKILIPGQSDTQVVRWAGHELITYLTKKNIQVLEYQPTILHAKTMIIDDTAYIGSFNLNHRSLLHDLEVELEFQEPAVLKEMLNIWNEDISKSRILTLPDLKAKSLLKRLFFKLIFKMRYMM